MTQDELYRQAKEYFAKHATDQRFHCHQFRYLRSLSWIFPFVLGPDGNIRNDQRLLDVGGPSPWFDFLRSVGLNVDNTDERELTQMWEGIQPNTYDLVMCMEVIEHVKDLPGRRDEFDASGIRALVGEIARVLKPGGSLFMSTPNICCYAGIYRMMKNTHPFVYAPHHRELAAPDVVGYLRERNLEVSQLDYELVWTHPVPHDVKKFLLELCSNGYNVSGVLTKKHFLEGDCIFVLATK
jgi:SAM-dependent methyltransferase